jgi:glycine cleavage system H protein
VRTEGDAVVTIGITHYAQGELGDVVYVDLPEVGTQVDRMDVFGTIEAVKAVSELFSPLGGEVVEINSALDGDPSLVNKDPYDDGWMIKLQLRDAAELDGLLSPSDYAQHIGE